jgi:hypothetical protein
LARLNALDDRIYAVKRATLLLLAGTLAGPSLFAQLDKAEKKEGFKPLLNKSLKGWKGDSRLWKVEKGILTGSTDGVKINNNTFLISEREYSDFVLRAEFKLRNHNSGIQFRSAELPDFVVQGLQADIAYDNWTGSIYDEKGKRGVIVNGWKGKGEKFYKKDEWNQIELSAIGENIVIKINGQVTSELKDTSKPSGILAIQLHRGPDMKVEFRNIRLKEAKATK